MKKNSHKSRNLPRLESGSTSQQFSVFDGSTKCHAHKLLTTSSEENNNEENLKKKTF